MRWGAVCGVGGGIFAKTAKTPPLQSALHVALRPNIAHFSPVAMRISCTPHAYHLWGPYDFYHDAAWEGRALGVGRATLGPPLQHLPYQGRNGKS